MSLSHYVHREREKNLLLYTTNCLFLRSSSEDVPEEKEALYSLTSK